MLLQYQGKISTIIIKNLIRTISKIYENVPNNLSKVKKHYLYVYIMFFYARLFGVNILEGARKKEINFSNFWHKSLMLGFFFYNPGGGLNTT